MTGEAGQSAARAAAVAETKNPAPKAQPTEPTADKKLSNAELKKRAKEEKAARRAAAKSALPSGPASQPQQGAGSGAGAAAAAISTGPAAAPDKASKARPKHDGQLPHARLPLRPGPLPPGAGKEAKAVTVPECFSHLYVARRIPLSQADKHVHPVVLALGQHMAAFAISDSITRLETTLLAFKKVIDAYSTPPGATFSRHFTSHVLNPQIDYLTACRPMCFAMGNAIRWLKLQVSRIDIDKADSDVKRQLCQAIDSFIHERITVADLVIVEAATAAIDDGAVVVTYARHHLVERALLRVRAAGKCFRVILVDDAYERVGIALAKTLAAAAIPVSYVSDLGALRSALQAATLVLLAAEAMFSNGAMYARAGTADIAAAAADLHLTVVALCESINFTERLSVDSLTYNEIDPNLSSHDGFRLLFDTTRDKYISVIVTELGNTSAKSVLDILRKLEEL